MTKKGLTGILTTISKKYQETEEELNQYKRVWDFLCENYNGNPLENLDELLRNKEDMKKLFEEMGIES